MRIRRTIGGTVQTLVKTDMVKTTVYLSEELHAAVDELLEGDAASPAFGER